LTFWEWLKGLLGLEAQKTGSRLEIRLSREPAPELERGDRGPEWAAGSLDEALEKIRAKRTKSSKRPTLLELSRRRHPSSQSKLPRSFTNRPGVRKARVELKKSGYDEDAKPER